MKEIINNILKSIMTDYEIKQLNSYNHSPIERKNWLNKERQFWQ